MTTIDSINNWFIQNFGAITIEQVKSWFVYNEDEKLLFNTGLFLGLFLVFYFVYGFLRKTFYLRLTYVILFSLFFYYKSSGIYFLLLLLSSVVDYGLSQIIYKESRDSVKKFYLVISVILNLALLGYFKYMNFLIVTYNDMFHGNFALHNVFLPVGISFYTFQSMSYIIEIYREEIKPTKNYIEYLFFVSFFPQLVAGPIVRAKDFLPQIYQKLNLTRQDVNNALFLIIGGLIKKTVISNYISVNFVDRVFDTPLSYTSFENLMASYGYAIQIYCDFSGYSDMAIGIALLLGFKLPANFRTPYKSTSITDFWRRWHISLSTWLKDFLYISIGGNRNGSFAGYLFPSLFFFGLLLWGISNYNESVIPLIVAGSSILVFCLSFLLSSKIKQTLVTNFNLFTTMLLGGLWHGAGAQFIVWGALHGLALAVHKIFMEFFPSKKDKSPNFLWRFFSIVITFHFVVFCWIFFRARDFETALQVINNIGQLTFEPELWKTIVLGYKNVFGLMLFGYVWHFLPETFTNGMKSVFDKTPILVKAIILGFVYWIVYATAVAGSQPFIYFQF
ncbi:D-alanyl-lipoteichoic acid acyltransferase DltB (MBOAT superfamily) [Flavobacterium nitrogenifigens]|uniref:D-alanyl-lipoteichoic acid acyltransferase DltB (MBOAT superfamily) n=2 Tax=Flavobacterium TaxID=237 RepID=A0A7W7IZV9_9FLAO|nr:MULTISPECIES: MBOAT family protein [Flavobacterium]MBB4803588.1 D-alanyl-lipoteichoic acid acyltransferase DltB (MBOAT superfamily) [Flavobacterium nitrogenifigens]MBB6388607.1 D-alanyl-lipoteichoic acid acyltransferase DltB (MBOAT superfamily) [Flavobacterium notoginsengisoli]